MLATGQIKGTIITLALFLLGTDVATAQSNIAAITTPKASSPDGELNSNVYTTMARFGSIACDGDKMHIEIERDQLAAPIERYTLLEAACRPKATASSITFDFTPATCGTVFEGNETHWIVSNSVVNTNPQAPPMPGSVLLHTMQIGTFRCVYPKALETAAAQFMPNLIDYEYPLKGSSSSPITLGLFVDKEMTQPVDISKKLKLNTTLYGRVARQAVGDSGTFIVPVNCHSFPSSDPSTIQPMLNREIGSCWALREYNYISHTNDDYVFSFPVFGFVARGETITTECLVNTCKVGHSGEDCKIPKEPCNFGPDATATKVFRRGFVPVGASFSVDTSPLQEASTGKAESTTAATVPTSTHANVKRLIEENQPSAVTPSVKSLIASVATTLTAKQQTKEVEDKSDEFDLEAENTKVRSVQSDGEDVVNDSSWEDGVVTTPSKDKSLKRVRSFSSGTTSKAQ